MIRIENALDSLRRGAEWVVRGTEIEWLDKEQTQPTDAEIQTEIARLQKEHDNNKYQRDRKPLYGTWEEQLDMMYHGTWKDHVAKVKQDIPKGNS